MAGQTSQPLLQGNDLMKRTILVVDDSKMARMVVKGMLAKTSTDWEIAEAANAQEALDVLATGGVDIALDAILARARELDVGFVEKPLSEEALNAFLSGAALKLRRAGK
jgi:PleD family two-component response regulator